MALTDEVQSLADKEFIKRRVSHRAFIKRLEDTAKNTQTYPPIIQVVSYTNQTLKPHNSTDLLDRLLMRKVKERGRMNNLISLHLDELKDYIDNNQIIYFKNPNYKFKSKQLDEEAIDHIVANDLNAPGLFKIHDTIAIN